MSMTAPVHTKLFFTIGETAKLLGCSPRTITRKIASGDIKVTRLGSLVRIPRDALGMAPPEPPPACKVGSIGPSNRCTPITDRDVEPLRR